MLLGKFKDKMHLYKDNHLQYKGTMTKNRYKNIEDGLEVKFCYNGLWKILIDEGMLRKDLMTKAGITSSTIAKMGKGQPVSMAVIWRVCHLLNCDIGDIVSIENNVQKNL